jgi:hypothetical protein
MLAYSSRLVTIKAVIAAMPNHAMCALKVHYTYLDHVEGVNQNIPLAWKGYQQRVENV